MFIGLPAAQERLLADSPNRRGNPDMAAGS